MSDLSLKQLDALDLIKEKTELQKPFFKKTNGLKWFDSLQTKGFLKPSQQPGNEQLENGAIRFIEWPVLVYLENSAHLLASPEGSEYIPKFLTVIRSVTRYAIENNIENHRTWWQFTKIINHIPVGYFESSDMELFDYWLSDRFDRMMIGLELGERLLPRLLSNDSCIENGLTSGLLSLFVRVSWQTRSFGNFEEQIPFLCLDNYWSETIFDRNAKLIGESLGEEGLEIIRSSLQKILDKRKKDAYSHIWRSAIENHEQNSKHEDVPNLLVSLFRDVLNSYIQINRSSSHGYLKSMLDSRSVTLGRLVIHAVNVFFNYLKPIATQLLNEKYFTVAYHHELYWLLKNNFVHFPENEKSRIFELIQKTNKGRENPDATKDIQRQQQAYSLLRLLLAVQGHGYRSVDELYVQQLNITDNRVPDHPDFHIYSGSAGWIGEKTPIDSEELLSMPHDEIIKYLKSFQPEKGWNQPTKYGLGKALKNAIEQDPKKFKGALENYSSLELVYIDHIIDAYRDLWRNSKKIERHDNWEEILGFIKNLIEQPSFWRTEPATDESDFIVGTNWIAGTIAETISTGTMNDDSAFSEDLNDLALEIIDLILAHVDREEFNEKTDAVSVAINSARGKTIEALLNCSLRVCRLADHNESSHQSIWEKDLRNRFDVQIELAETDNYEFVTLFVNRWPNFVYLNNKWAEQQLPVIFDNTDIVRWSSAIQGLAYVNGFYPILYRFLRENGHLVRALNLDYLPKQVSKRIIHLAIVAYFQGEDDLDNTSHFLSSLIDRFKLEEIRELIWFVWTLRDNKNNNIKPKVLLLWKAITEKLSGDKESQILQGKLAKLSVYIDTLDEQNMALLMDAAPYSDVGHNSYIMIAELNRLVDDYPEQVATIFLEMLKYFAPTFRKEDIFEILESLKKEEGTLIKGKIKEILDGYIAKQSGLVEEIFQHLEHTNLHQ